MYATTRTPHIPESELGGAIAQLRADAGERGAALDIAVAYTDDSLHRPDADFGKHRAALEALAEAGATWLIVPGQSHTRQDSVAFLERFGHELVSI